MRALVVMFGIIMPSFASSPTGGDLPKTAKDYVALYGEEVLHPEKVAEISFYGLKVGYELFLRVDDFMTGRAFRYRIMLREREGDLIFFERIMQSIGGARIKVPENLLFTDHKMLEYSHRAKDYRQSEDGKCRFVIGKCYRRYEGVPTEVVSEFRDGVWYRHFSNGVSMEDVFDRRGFLLYRKVSSLEENRLIRREATMGTTAKAVEEMIKEAKELEHKRILDLENEEIYKALGEPIPDSQEEDIKSEETSEVATPTDAEENAESIETMKALEENQFFEVK